MSKTASGTAEPTYRSKLGVLYREQLISELKEELKLGNVHQVPALRKVVVSVGLGRAKEDKKVIAAATNTLIKITGQKPIPAHAKKSIASFKLREGQQVGLKVTLRGERMYEFADRLINIVLPRLRDFHGVNSSSFDTQGSYHLGLVDQSVFPELTFEETATVHGLQVSFVISPSDKDMSKLLLQKMGMPFDKIDQVNTKEIGNG